MENNKCPKIKEFCYVCGHIVPKVGRKERRNLLTPEFTFAYTQYFDEADTSGEDFTPNTVCNNCYSTILNWFHRRRGNLHFAKPVIWVKDPNGHDETRCYACINYDVGTNKRKLKTKAYVAAFTASLPVPRSDGVEPPKPPSLEIMSLCPETVFSMPYNFQDPDYAPNAEDDEPKPLTQNEMDYIVAKLGLSQRNSEFLTSFLKCRKLTQQNVSATAYRKRQAEFQNFYTVDDKNTFTYCNDIKGLVNNLGMEYCASDWRVFIDSSVSSLKVVLLHKTNKKPSIPLALGTNMKENYETLDNILKKIKYIEHKWKICCDLKVVNILQGVISNGGFPKYFCFRCDWDSRSKVDHYQCNDWRKRTHENEKRLKLVNEPLIKNIDDILLPPLHIKLGIAKKFIEMAVKDNEEVFDCLKNIFPKLSNDKIKNGVLNGPDIKKLMKSEKFTNVLANNHRRAWDALKAVIVGVLGKNRVQPEEAKKLVKAMLDYFHKINASMTLKLHFLHQHFDEFLLQLPTESDEQGERFHQITMPMEKRYKGKKLDALLAEVCWWSHKVSQYETTCNEVAEDDTFGGHTERYSPLNMLSSSDDEDDKPRAPTSMDID